MHAQDKLLRPVVKNLCDSARLFQNVAEVTRSPQSRDFAFREMQVRRRFLAELRALLKYPEQEPTFGTLLGFLRRRGKDLLSMLPDSENGVLDVMESQIQRSSKIYLQTLEKNPESGKLREILQKQQAYLLHAQRDLRALRGQEQPRFI